MIVDSLFKWGTFGVEGWLNVYGCTGLIDSFIILVVGFCTYKIFFVVFRALILKGLKRKERVASSVGSIMGFG